MNTTENINTQEIKNTLKHFHGSQSYYRCSPFLFPRFHLTEGTNYLAESCNAFWLFDFIASHQENPAIKNHAALQNLQFWDLTVKNSEGVITCSWDKNEVVLTENISYTDFPLDSISIWVAPIYFSPDDTKLPKKWVAYLPSEH